MDAGKTIFQQTEDLRKTWQELWWAMAGGVKSEYDRIKATETMEFWRIFDLWREKVERENKALQARQRK